MARHLLLRLCSPMVAFGGEVIDKHGVIRTFPAVSMITGLLANALGWDRGDSAQHNRLQARLVMGARIDSFGDHFVDFQTAQLESNDKGWTTRGRPEGRAGASGTYAGPHLRYRHYGADGDVLVAMRLKFSEEYPTLDDLANALDKPFRPLFVGRKNCIPSGRLMAGWVEADNILNALEMAPPALQNPALAQWPESEGRLSEPHQMKDVCDERSWTSGIHGGWRPVIEGVLRPLDRESL